MWSQLSCTQTGTWEHMCSGKLETQLEARKQIWSLKQLFFWLVLQSILFLPSFFLEVLLYLLLSIYFFLANSQAQRKVPQCGRVPALQPWIGEVSRIQWRCWRLTSCCYCADLGLPRRCRVKIFSNNSFIEKTPWVNSELFIKACFGPC